MVQERVFEGETVDLILTLSEPLNFDPAQSEYQSEITEYTADQFAGIFEDISQDPAVRSYDMASFFDLGDEDLDRGFTAEVDLGLGADGFNFYNHEFQSGYIGVNGLLALSIGEAQRLDLYDQFDASGDLSADSTRVYNDSLIAPLWNDISLAHLITPGEPVVKTGEIYSLTRGEEPDRRFIVQWDNVYFEGEYDPDDPSNDDQALTFQLVLYEQTGDIEFRYLDVNNDASGVSSIGLNDGILGDRGVQLGNADQSRIVNNTVVRFERVRSLLLNSDNAADFEDAFPLEIPLTSFESENGMPRAEISLGILVDGRAEPQELVELQLELVSGLPLAFGDSGGNDSFIIEARQQIEVDIAVNPRRVLEGQTATVELTLSLPLPEDVPAGEIIIDTDEQNYADLGTTFPIYIPLADLAGAVRYIVEVPVLADDITEALELVDLRVTLPEINLADHELRLGANEGRTSFAIDAPDRTVDVDIAVPPGRGSVGDTPTLELTLSEPTDYVWRVFSDDSNFLDLRALPEALPANLVTSSVTELIDPGFKFAIDGVLPSELISLLGDGGNTNRAETFTFTFYGEDYSQIRVNREGFLTLGGSRLYNGPDGALLTVLDDAISRNPDYNTVPGDDRALPPVIAPWWGDFAGNSRIWDVHYGTIGEYPNRQFIVQWSDALPLMAHVVAEPITFQAVLYEGSNEIEFRYLDATTDSFTPGLDGGGAATIAIADSNARGGYVQVGYNQSVVTDNSRIRFTPGAIEVDVAEDERNNFDVEFPISVPLHEFRGTTRYTIELPQLTAQPTPAVRFTLSELTPGLQAGAGGDSFDYRIGAPIVVNLSVPNSGRVVEGESIELQIELSEPINFNTPLSNYVARTDSYSTEQFAQIFEDISQTGTPIAQLLESSPGQADLNDGWATRLFGSGFQFDFYGREYDRLFVNPDGLLTFSAPGAGGTRDYGLDSSNNSGLVQCQLPGPTDRASMEQCEPCSPGCQNWTDLRTDPGGRAQPTLHPAVGRSLSCRPVQR